MPTDPATTWHDVAAQGLLAGINAAHFMKGQPLWIGAGNQGGDGWHFNGAVDDVAVSRALFDAVLTWTRKRNLSGIKGPRALIGVDASGVLVEGFEHRPALTMPYNYSYYDRLIVDAGLVKDTDHLSAHPDRHRERGLALGVLPGDGQGYAGGDPAVAFAHGVAHGSRPGPSPAQRARPSPGPGSALEAGCVGHCGLRPR